MASELQCGYEVEKIACNVRFNVLAERGVKQNVVLPIPAGFLCCIIL